MNRRSFIYSVPLVGVALEAVMSAKAVARATPVAPLLNKNPGFNMDAIWNEAWKDASEENYSRCEKEKDYKARVINGTKR